MERLSNVLPLKYVSQSAEHMYLEKVLDVPGVYLQCLQEMCSSL